MLEFIKNTEISVKLDKRIIGKIKQVNGGWQYFPKGSKRGGEVFSTESACKQSLY